MKLSDISGAVFGLVVGDALGVPVEFMPRQALAADPVTGMREYGTHGQPAGTWSDDGSMALCLMESLTNGIDYEDMMKLFLRWAYEGHWAARGALFDIGIATQKALMNYVHRIPPLECGGRSERDNGNGSLMRILPLALYLHKAMGSGFNDAPDAYDVIHNASRLTHAHPISLIACGIYCSVVNELLIGFSTEAAVHSGIEKAKAVYAKQKPFAEWLDRFNGISFDCLKAKPMSNIRGSGYVLQTLEAALWCLLHTESFSSCVLQAVNLGEDTDTVGAVAGGLAGLCYGIEAIPAEWLSVIARREEIEALCGQFADSLLIRTDPGDPIAVSGDRL